MIKSILNKIINVVCVVIIVIAILMLALVCMARISGSNSVLGFSAFRVLTESMEPTIPADAFVLVKTCGADELSEGDVISFYSNDPLLGGAVNTHRVQALNRGEDGKVLSIGTKGDNNMTADIYRVYPKDLIGKVVFTSPLLGAAVRLLSNPLVFVPIILVPLLFIFISNVRSAARAVKELGAASEEELRQIAEGGLKAAGDAKAEIEQKAAKESEAGNAQEQEQ